MGNLISNVIWERADRGYNNFRSYRSYRSDSLDHLRGRMSVRRLGDYGSILTIRDFDSSLDGGVYRCVATRSYRGYSSYSGQRELSTWRWTSIHDTTMDTTTSTMAE